MKLTACSAIIALSLSACTNFSTEVDGFPFDDCTQHDNVSARCRWDVPQGSVGAGPSWGQRDVLMNGFVEGSRLIVAVAPLVWEPGVPGRIFTIDLVSGERTLVSGIQDDPRNGGHVVGSGPPLNGLFDVQPSSNAWFAMTDDGIIRIDRSTGDRSMFYAWQPGSCGAYPRTGLAVTPDGTVFAGVAGPGVPGIIAIDSYGCRLVSRGGAQPLGRGPDLQTPTWFAVSGQTLFVADAGDQSIISVDIRTGDRVRVSSARSEHQVGGGDGQTVGEYPISVAQGGIWTYTFSGPTWIDFTSGTRTATAIVSGPRSLGGYGEPRNAVWHHPTLRFLVATEEFGLVVINPLTGASNWLSR